MAARPTAPTTTLAIAVLAVTLVAGCAGSDRAGPGRTRPTGTTVAAPAPSPVPGSTSTTRSNGPAFSRAEQEVADTYVDIMRRYFLRMQHPDPHDSDLDDLYVEPAKGAVVARAKHLRELGAVDELTEHGVPTTEVLRVSVAGDTALLRSCIVDDVRVIRTSDGRILNATVLTKLTGGVMLRFGERWKLKSNTPLARWADRKGCAR